jgi:hypothetical protein
MIVVLMPLKVLNLAFVLFRGLVRFERPKVFPFSGFRVGFPRIKPVFA